VYSSPVSEDQGNCHFRQNSWSTNNNETMHHKETFGWKLWTYIITQKKHQMVSLVDRTRLLDWLAL
jgi:maltose-binding protein MalE